MVRECRLTLTVNCRKIMSKEVGQAVLQQTLMQIIEQLQKQKRLDCPFTLTVQSFDPTEQLQEPSPYEVDVLAQQILLFDREHEIDSFVQTQKLVSNSPVEQLTQLSVSLIKLCQQLSVTRRQSGMAELPSISHHYSKEQLDSMEELCYHNLSVVRERRKKTDTCVICLQRYAQRILLPCMHLAVCGSCSEHPLPKCPMCKCQVTDVRQVFR